MNYLDFDLLIERSGNGYIARVDKSAGGEAMADFQMPFNELEIENFLLKLGRSKRGMRRVMSPEVEAAKAFGKKLFETVFKGEILGCLHTSMYDATQRDSGLRLRLRIVNAPELVDLPWEYLYYPPRNRFLSLSVDTPLVRYIDLPAPIRPLEVKPPLQVLVVISSPTNHPQLNVEREWSILREALRDLELQGLLALERLDKATLTDLQRRLRQKDYHIFHFIGHGGFDTQAEDGILIFEDESRLGRAVSGQYLGTLLANHRPLRMAVLNACEGARSGRTDPFSGTAQSLVQQGISAVIAMQFEISDEAAITFAHEFYAAMADGYTVDAALVEARVAIYNKGNNIEWGTPVLYMRAPNGRIFNVERVNDEQRRQAKLAFLFREAQTAVVAEDWSTAQTRLQEVLASQPAHTNAKTLLKQLPEEQETARLYAQACELYDAQRWQAALDCFTRVHELRPNYKQAEAFIRDIEKLQTEQTRRERLGQLTREAEQAEKVEDWPRAVEKYHAMLELAPQQQTAKTALANAQHEMELTGLYAQGRQHYEAKRWQQALECLRRVQEKRPHYKETANLIAAIVRLQEEHSQREQIVVLLREAEQAERNEDWPSAIKKYQTILAREPNHAAANAGLKQAQQELDLAELYARGKEHYEAKRWDKALDYLRRVQKFRPNYKQVEALLTTIQREQSEGSRYDHISQLMREAQEAIARENWRGAVEKYQAVLALDPSHAKARAGLNIVRQEQELAQLYANGLEHYEAKRWNQARESLEQVQRVNPGYHDIDALLAIIQNEMSKGKGHGLPKYVYFLGAALVAAIIIFMLISRDPETEPQAEPVSPSKKETPSLSPSQTASEAQKPALVRVTILAEPRDAQITVANETFVSGQRLASGAHTLRISKAGFETRTETVQIAARDTTLHFTLTEVQTAPPVISTGSIRVTSTPSGASILLDGRARGRTPTTITDVNTGPHDLTLKLSGYEDAFVSVVVSAGQTARAPAVLKALLPGRVRITVLPYGDIYIGNTLEIKEAESAYEKSLPVGSYTIKVVHPVLGTKQREIVIESSKTLEITIDLQQ